MKKRSNKLLRFFDYYLGIPFLFLLGKIFSQKRDLPKEIDTIGILKPVALGDMTLLSGIIRDLRHKFPFAKIIVFSGKDNSILIPHIQSVNINVVLPIKNPFISIRLLRDSNLDLLIDFCSWPRINAILSFFSKARYTIGFKTEKQARHFAYDKTIEHRGDIHEIDNYRNLISIFDVKFHHLPKLHIFEEVASEFENSNYCIFHLASGGYKSELRLWTFESWQKIFNYLKKKKIKVLLLGTKEDFILNKKFINFCNKPKEIQNFAGKFSFSQTISILSQAKAVISVNTGIMHIAAALKVPTIGLNGPTNMNRWGVLGSLSYNISPEVEKCGFLNLGFEYKKQRKDCMSHIDPKKVINKLSQILCKS